MSKHKIDNFVAQVSIIFKSYNHQVVISQNKANLWHFSSTYRDKKYNVYCTLNMSKVKSLIKIALKKTLQENRLVVICMEHSEEEAQSAQNDGYALIDFPTLQKYGTEIIEARAKEAMQKAAGQN